MKGMPVTITAANHQDIGRWMTSAALQRMKELGVSDKLEHELVIWTTQPGNDYPLNLILKVACKCGWKIKKYAPVVMNTASGIVQELLTEHALWRTDPDHYTYYPAHAR